MEEKKILLVEDNQDHVELITDAFELEDIENKFILMYDGQKVIDYFQEIEDNGIRSQIALILLDLNLPKVNGMAVLRFLKKYSRYRSIPVIIFSASSDQKTISEAYENRANGFITKSLSHESFAKSIKSLNKYWLNTNIRPIN